MFGNHFSFKEETSKLMFSETFFPYSVASFPEAYSSRLYSMNCYVFKTTLHTSANHVEPKLFVN